MPDPLHDIPAPGSRVLVVPEELAMPTPWLTETGDYACAVEGCGHALAAHDLDGTTCRLCALTGDRHGFQRVLPPASPTVFCSETEAQERLAALKAQETAQDASHLTQTPEDISPMVYATALTLEPVRGLHDGGASRHTLTLDLDPEVIAAARAQQARVPARVVPIFNPLEQLGGAVLRALAQAGGEGA